ncbi:hypothetical protein FCM35_KLT15075 [Carex littledalei]|uniref:Uncharacterized protein n=1 Tax=Carex littledalei TaxID=544730 RepID=A0A833QE87_9POAL|nr:hypothetical protein FCM35_KLT15075 [Carex littledalei]
MSNQPDELMPDEGLGDQADRAQPRNRKKRGPSLCKNQPDGKEWVVEWDEFWRPVGQNAGKYASWVGLEARQRVDILYDSWERVDDTERDELWEAVKNQMGGKYRAAHCSREDQGIKMAHILVNRGRIYGWDKEGTGTPGFRIEEL